MKIVMVGPFGLRPKGTVSVRALPLARALVRRGHCVSVLVPPWNYPQDSGRSFEDEGVLVRNVTLPAPLPVLNHLEITRCLVRMARAEHADVIHAFKPKSYAGLTAWVWWNFRRFWYPQARLVVDTDDWEGAGGWNDLEPYGPVQRAFFAWQERWGLTHADAVTVASRALQTLAWSLGVPRSHVFYLPNGVSPAAITPAPARIAAIRDHLALGEQPVVLLYTRFFEFRLERLVAVWREVVADRADARLLIVGKGLFGEETRLRRLMADAGLAGTVIEAGWVEAEDVPGYLALADVALFPMDDTLLNRTKCSVKLAELLAAGVPVVAEAVGQVAEYIEPGTSGLLVPAGHPKMFAGALLRLLRDEKKSKALGRAARERMQREFSWDRLAALAEAAYLA